MKVIYEYATGLMIYGEVYELSGKTVSVSNVTYQKGESRRIGKASVKKFESDSLAEKYFQMRIKGAQKLNWQLVEGTLPSVDLAENFIAVKDKSEAYRYFENPQTGMFVDIDLDYTDVYIHTGKVGEIGKEEVISYDWDGDATKAYKNKIKEFIKDGYILKQNNFNSKDLSALYGLKFPKVLSDFYDKKLYEEYENHSIGNLPTYKSESHFMVQFNDPGLSGRLSQINFDKSKHPGLIPLSGLEEEPGLLMVQTNQKDCPVYLFMSSDAVPHLVNESLNGFLKSLSKPKEKTASKVSKPPKKTEKIKPKGQKLLRKK
tara:strand:- start:36007 stop:36957 length:951 start_codon:yes stop_codon:yes gene_type:complete